MKFGDYLKNRKNQTETESKKTVSENSFGAYLQGREAEKVESLYHSYLKDVQDLSTANKARFFDDKGNYIEKYRVDSDEWYNSSARATNLLKSKAQKIRKYLDDYGGYHDDEYVSQLRTQLDSNDSYLDDLLKSAEDHKEYNSQWKDEDAYNNDMMDWLEEDYESTPEKVKARRDRFKSNTDRVAQIKEEIKALEVKRSEAFSDPNTSMDVVATYDDKIAALEDERDKLKVENRKYERHHKTDSYYDVTESEDFAETSAKRKFANPTEAELDKYDSDLYNAERWYADNAVYGATKDENGNVYDAKGNLKFSVTPASVEDKLGLFLSSSKDDVARASNELANNTDVNNTWASTLNEGRLGDWSQLKEGEIGIYYYLLNTKGQEEAYKYLDDMTVELNRRATEEMEKEISGASFLEKLAYNVASTPANIIGGVPALIDNISHVVQGEEINPYSKANSSMNFASASRGALAEEINERTGNASIPYIGTTWGDAYQAVMSGADSWVGAATFGPSYLSLMSSNAAASKMKEMYENGATTSQMVIGGGVAGAAEYLFEKLPLEGMLKILKDKDLKGGRAIASAWLKQSATEAFEEMGTETTNILADALVLGSQSDLAGYVDKYIANGDSKGLAIWKALAYDVAPEVINAGIGGLISGGAIGGVASVAKYANYRAETTNHGRGILKKKGVPALKSLADEVAGVTEGKLGKDIGKLSSKVSATPLEGKNKLSTAIKNRNNAYAIGRLSDMVDTARVSLNTADVVSALEEKGLSPKEAKKGAETIISRINGEDVELDNLKVAEVYNELVGEGESQLKESITERNIRYTATRLGIDAKNRTVDGKSIEKEVSTEGRIAESGKTTRISTGEEITIDKSKPIAKTKTVDGVDKIFFNTDKGVVEASDITYANENEALIYESFADLHPSVASAAIKAYDGTVPAQTYIKGMREGILLYGKYNFQEVGKDISVNSDLAQLSSADQALALKLGKAVANIETSTREKAIKSAIKTVTEKAEKDTADGKKTEKKGKVSFREGAKPQGHSQKRAVTLAKVLSKAIGIDIVFYDSMRDTNKALRESNGMFDPDTDTMYLDLQHSTKDAHTIAFTMSHELVHFVKKYSLAKFKVFADFLMEEYAKHGVSTSTLLSKKMEFLETDDTDPAYEEMIADACERMLLDSDVMLKLAKLKKIDLDLFEKIRLHILDILNKIRAEYKRMNYAPTSDEAKALLKMEDVIGKLHEKFEEMVVDATETYQTIGTINLNDYSKAKNTDGGTLFQYKAIKADESAYRGLLQEHTDMTNAEINNLFSTIDKAVDIIKDNLEILDYAWEEDIDDRAFNPVKQNSDPLYKFSVDFSTMCRKRILQQVIIEELQGALDRAVTKAESIAIRNELMKLQEQGRQIEIACALCYVESARMKSPAQIQKFLDDRGDVVRRYFATKSAGEIKERVAKAEADTRKKLAKQYAEEIAKGDMPDPTEMVGKKTKKFVSLKSLPQKMAEEIRVAKRAVIDGYKPNANESEIIKTAESLSVEDFTSAKGLENLAKYHAEIFDAYTSYIRNATKSKGTEKDVWWRIGDSQKLTDDLIATMNAENGLRTQSWSDFQVMHLLDYIGAIIELSTRKAKMQAYTKVPDYVHLMGNTNQMINLSLIPVAEFNGKLDFDSVEGMAFKTALELRDKYPASAGTISIGINNEQIRMLLESVLIDYVIPYHQSGMSKVVRKQMHIPTWTSYEPYQSEKNLKYEDAKRNAKAYGVELLSTKDPMWHKAPKFSEWFDAEVAKQIAEMENHTPTDPASQKKYGVMYGAYKAMQNAADTYLKMCAERGISPKFSHESCDFTKEDNYWKLLIDRKMINNITGEIIEQKPVQAVFDESEILRILNDEVARYPKVKEDQDYATRTVVSKFLSGEMDEDTAKIAASILEKPVNNITKVSILNSTDDITPSKNVKKQAKKSESTDKFNEYSIQTALWDALDHKDEGHDNLIRISNMPSYVVDKFGIDGDFYIYRDHAYENMVTKDQAIIDGRPIKRSGEYIHFHGFGVEKMTSAILSINHPTMTISTKTKDGNPAVVMVLDEFGFNNAPLYAVLSFYSNRGINGRLDRKPHIVFTVAEREYIGTEGRSGYDEIIKNAIKDGRVLDYNAKKRDDLSVIAESAGLGNITKSSLEHNLSRFRKEVNSFREKNKISYQKKRPSNRELLSNALEKTIDTSSAEGKVLQEYKNNIGKIEELEAHLAEVKTEIYKLSFGKGARDNARLKELNEDKVKTANRINIYDKKLLRIEATKPLKDILVREKEKVRKAEKQKGEEALQRLKEKDAATLREVMERNQESRRKNVEGRQKTEMRNKIKGVVGDLNKMFKAGRKKANVKAGMRDTVAQALATAELLFSNDITNEDIVRNGVTVATSAESKKLNRYMDLLSKREAYLNKIDVMMGASLSADIDGERQMVEKIDKEIRVLDKELKDVFERERNRLNEVVISSAIQDLADAYKSIKDSEQSYISAAYNEYVYDRLLLLKEEVGGSSIRDMSMDQLRDVYEAYKMVLHVVRTANTLFKDGKAVDDIADAVVSEIKSIAKPRNRTVPTELLNRAVWNELKPRTAFETVGSDTLLELYDNLRKGEDTFAMDVYEAFEFADGARKRHNYKKWDMKSRIDFKLESGKTFSVNLQQLMSIYAYSKREQAHKHMTNGGFVFDSKETFTKKKRGIIEFLPTAETYRLSANDISKIINTLAEKYSDAKAYVDEMQKYLTDMGEKGNEVSRLVFGIDLFKEKVYFPLQSSRDYLRSNNDALDKKNATPSLINSGMTKETTPNAENPIVLSGFDNVWASHTNKMSLYHSFVPALEDFRKVYEYSSSAKGTDYVSVRAEITNVFGANATDYISKFIDDVNGGMPNNEISNPIMSLFSTFKKTSVGMSLSTVIQQPTAIIRAWSILNPKYFAGVPHNNLSPAQWDEIKRYAPIAILKEIGGFDAGSGRGMVDYLAGDVNKTWLKKTSSTIDDASMWLAGKGDVLGWGMIWNAVKREVADTTNLTEGSEEFLEKCGERFTEVITETQVYDSTFSRSGYMRSKKELNKFATSFMAEPTTAINMLYRAVINAIRGKISKGEATVTIASAVLSQFMASALVSLIYAARDDDEDESYLEKYFESLGGRIRDDINVLNMLPYLRDIQSLFDGWDVERPDMAIFADIKKAYDGLQSKTKSPYMKWRDFIAAISNAFGVPLGNLERDLRAVFYNVPKMLFDDATPTFENSLEAFGDGLADKDTSMKERAWNAHQKGNTSKVKRTVAEMVEAKVKSGKTEKEAKSGVRSSFTLTYKKAYLEALDDKDYKTMNDIRKFLFSTGLYGSLSELDKSLENWRKSK